MSSFINDNDSDTIQEISLMLSVIFPDSKKALEWMKRPRKSFNNLCPLEYLSSHPGRSKELLRELKSEFAIH